MGRRNRKSGVRRPESAVEAQVTGSLGGLWMLELGPWARQTWMKTLYYKEGSWASEMTVGWEMAIKPPGIPHEYGL